MSKNPREETLQSEILEIQGLIDVRPDMAIQFLEANFIAIIGDHGPNCAFSLYKSAYDRCRNSEKKKIEPSSTTAYKIMRKSDGLFAKAGLSRFTKSGKVWNAVGHIKLALSYQFGTFGDNRAGYRKPSELNDLVILNVATGEQQSAYELWKRPPKK